MCVFVRIYVFIERSLHLRVWLITLILRGVGGDICSCTGVRARCVCVKMCVYASVCCMCTPCTSFTCDLRCVCTYVQSQTLVMANAVCMYACFSYNLCVFSHKSLSVCVYKCMACSSWCVCVCVWVCVMNRRFRCSARNTLLSAAGASWHRQGTRCQSSAGTCSVDQWHFFFFFQELKTGSGRPGINSRRGWLNPPSHIIRSKYVNLLNRTQNYLTS